MSDFTLIMPGKLSKQLEDMVNAACSGKSIEVASDPYSIPDLKGKKLLFAVQLNNSGICIPMLELLSELFSRGENSLSGCTGAMLVHSESELYTKSAAQEIIFLANRLGCRFPGHPVIEATLGLKNFMTWQKRLELPLYDICIAQSSALGDRLLNENPKVISSPKILALHSSNRKTSNTLELWHMVSKHLNNCSISELHVENGGIQDCNGCTFTACLHYGMQNSCFYGGSMVKEILPAIQKADAVVWICPNYNDAISANLMAVINRMTALYRAASFYNKSIFSVIVSGNSGSDSVAKQLIGALNINKGFRLPPAFSIMAIANNTGEIKKAENIYDMSEKFALHIANEIKA